MFHQLVNIKDEDTDEAEAGQANSKKEVLKNMKRKINFVSKMFRLQKILREESESILLIKSFNNDKIPLGLLFEGKEALAAFVNAKSIDMKNEMRPN